MRIFQKEEEKQVAVGRELHLHEIMETNCRTKSTWFSFCLTSLKAMHFLLEDHLLPPKTMSEDDERILSSYWRLGADALVKQELKERRAYEHSVRALFSD